MILCQCYRERRVKLCMNKRAYKHPCGCTCWHVYSHCHERMHSSTHDIRHTSMMSVPICGYGQGRLVVGPGGWGWVSPQKGIRPCSVPAAADCGISGVVR